MNMKLLIFLTILLNVSHIYARESLPVCEIFDNEFGLNLFKDSALIGTGYSLSGAYKELENLLNKQECGTSFNRSCFYTDLLEGGRSIGIVTNEKKLIWLGTSYGSESNADRDLNKAMSLGLCNQIISIH